MSIKLKVCGMRDPSNIGELVKLAPDFMGFIFYPKSKRFIGASIAKEILNLIPDSIKKVGVFVDEPFESLVARFEQNSLDLVQLHGAENPSYCEQLMGKAIPVIKVFRISPDFDFGIVKSFENSCTYFLFDTAGEQQGGTGLKFDWHKLNQVIGDTPFFLSGGIQLSDVQTIKELPYRNLVAIDVNSGFETEPGIKDISKLAVLITQLREVNN